MGNGDGATAQIIVVEHGESGQSCGNRWCGSKFGLDPFGIREALLREPETVLIKKRGRRYSPLRPNCSIFGFCSRVELSIGTLS